MDEVLVTFDMPKSYTVNERRKQDISIRTTDNLVALKKYYHSVMRLF